MARSSFAVRLPSSGAIVARAGLALAMCLLVITTSHAQEGEQAAAALGIGENHGSLSLAPWEQIDPYSGNVLLTFTDIDLPGNAGFHLTVRRQYNSKNGFYPLFDWGFPLVATRKETNWAFFEHPVILMPDGSVIRTLQDYDDPTLFLTTSRWRFHTYDAVHPWTLETPDGVRYVYDVATDHPLYKEDAFGNRVDVVPDPNSPTWRVGSLVQHLGPGETRTVLFGYDADGRVASLTANGRTWSYSWVAGTSTAIDPTGATWTISCAFAVPLPDPTEWMAHADTFTVTTSTGGWLRYLTVYHDAYPPVPGEWDNFPKPPPRDPRWIERVVRQRDTGGTGVVPSTLQFDYQSSDDLGTLVFTTVEGANGTVFNSEYQFRLAQDVGDGNGGEHVLETVGGPGPKRVEYEITKCWVTGKGEGQYWAYGELFGEDMVRHWSPLVTGRATTQNDKTFTQQWTDYDCTWGQPRRIQEAGDFTRTTIYAYEPSTGSVYRAPGPTSVTVQGLAQGLTTAMTFDATTGFMTSRTTGGIQATFEPDAFGNVASAVVHDALDANHTQTTSFTYDWGVVSGTHSPMTHVTSVINEDGTVASSTQIGPTTQTERTTTYEYDAAGRLTGVQLPGGPAVSHPTQTEYAPDHSWVRVYRGATSTWSCGDGLGRTVATIASAGRLEGMDLYTRTDTEYDALGRVGFTSLPYETTSTACTPPERRQPGTTFEYDDVGRLTRRTNPDNTVVTMAYPEPTSQEFWVRVTDESGHPTTQTFEATGSPTNARLHSVTDAAGNLTTYAYDDYGNLATVTSPTQPTTPTSVTRQWHYDANNRLAYQIQPESGTTTYQYDGFGRLGRQTDALDRQRTYTYDDENRLTDVATVPDPADWTHVEYDEWGDRVAADNATVTTTFEYDVVHRLTRRGDRVNDRTFESVYDYDPDDQLIGLQYPSGNHVRYLYDGNRLSGVDDPVRGLTFASLFEYHPSGGLASYTTGNGVVHSISYDPQTYRVHEITGGGGFDLTYDYWPDGNVRTITDARQNPVNPQQDMTSNFTYDAVDRLKTATGPWGALSWEYDAIGNRTSQTKNGVDTGYAYTSTNRLDHTTGGQVEAFHYDGAGLLHDDSRGIYLYTSNNLQRQADLAVGGSVSYSYDADGQRVVKQMGSGVSETYSLRGPAGVLSEFEESAGQLGWTVDYVYAAERLIATTKPPTGEWHTLKVTHEGGAGRVTSVPAGLECDRTCTERFTQQTVVTLTATPGTGQTFSGWSDACTGTAVTTTVTITGDQACTAWFSSNPQLTLTLAGSGSGHVETDPAGLSCDSTCTAGVTPGASVTLIATPHAGSRFAGWSGDAGCATGAVTLNGSVSCTATFVRTYTLTVTKAGEGAIEGAVTSSPAGVACGSTCAATYDTGTAVTLTADWVDGYEFQGWSGAGCTAGTTSVTVSMTQARTCTASFAALPPAGCDPEAQAACRGDGLRWDEDACLCEILWFDPLVLTLDGSPVHLTDAAGGVGFDLTGDGLGERVAWTRPGTRAAFLVLDLDGDGAITTAAELLGMRVGAPRRQKPEAAENSFTLLAAYDRPENGGNGDGAIGAADAVFERLRLWIDANHDGVSQPGELVSLAAAGVAAIELTSQPTGRRDGRGNYYRYRGLVHLASGATVPIWDVFLAVGAGPAPDTTAGLAWPGGSRPASAGLAGFGAGLIALGLAGLCRGARRRTASVRCATRALVASGGQERLPHAAAVRVGVAGATTLAVVLLWPSPTFGQTWQVVEYYDTDALGSVRVVTDAQGAVLARHDFLPFGEELSPQTPPHDKKLFTGQERDFETGQDYFGARQLRTDLGRFLAPDPITLVPRVVGAQGVNSYAYVRNNPLGLIDPSGLDPTDLRPEEGDCSWTSWAFREDRGATYDPLGIPPSLAGERGQPVRLIRVGTTTYSQPTKVNDRLFVGTVYEYEVVDEDGRAVTGLIEVEEVHRKTANTRQLPIESIWTTSTGRFKDGVGYYADAGPAPRSYYNEARQKFIVTQDRMHTTLSTVVLQRWWSDEGGHFFGQADIIVR